MKNWWIAFLVLPALAVSTEAQTGSSDTHAASPAVGGVSPGLSGGTGVVAELAGSLDAKKAKAGDAVKATVVQDVLSHGQVVIRAGSKLLGHLTQVKASTKQDPESRLGITFEKVALKGGGELTLDAAVRALGPPTRRFSRVDQPDQMLPPGLGPTGASAAGSTAPQPLGRSSASRGGRATDPDTGTPTASNSNTTGRSNVDVPTGSAGTSPRGPDNGLFLSVQSRGVFGLPDLKLVADGNKGCVVTSAKVNVQLESGSQIVLEVNGPAGN